VSKPEVLVRAVTVEKLSHGEVAKRNRVSKSLVHRLHHRWPIEGDRAFLPRSSRPYTSPTRTPATTRDRVLALRDQLTGDGLDAEPDTVHTHLIAECYLWVFHNPIHSSVAPLLAAMSVSSCTIATLPLTFSGANHGRRCPKSFARNGPGAVDASASERCARPAADSPNH